MSVTSPEVTIEQAIVRNPLTIAPTATVADAIALMSTGNQCDFSCDINSEIALQLAHAQTSCVLVTEDKKLIGILTERDLVSFCGQSESGSLDNPNYPNQNLAQTAIAEVMVYPVHSLLEWEFTDLLVPLNRFQRHKIRHLPLVNDRGEVSGLVTHESLRQLLHPIDMLQVRKAKEIMIANVICAEATESVSEIANLMTIHKVSSIIINEYREEISYPLGIITESDIVQCLALELDLSNTPAHTVMSFPLISVSPNDSLWRVREIMQERIVNHLVITDNDGLMQGIITQSDILKTLQPKEVYKLVSLLESKMSRLEQEKLELLESRNKLLESQVQESKAALIDSNDMFQQFADNNRSVVLIRDIKTGHLLYVNSAYSQIWGLSTESLYEDPHSWMNAIHPEDRHHFNKAYELTVNTGFFNHEYRIIRPDGTVRWIYGKCFPLHNSKGECDRMAAIAEDISDRKNAQLALQESEAELRNLFANMQDYIFVINHQGIYIKSFPNHPETVSMIGKRLDELFLKTTADSFLATIHEVLASQQSRQIDYCIPVQGREKCFSTIVSPLSRETVLWVARDITERKQSEKELLLQQEFLSTVINASPNLIFVKNNQGEYMMANQAIADFYETSIENLIGKTDLDFQDDPATANKFQIEDRQVLSTNQPLLISEEESSFPHQEKCWLQWSKTPITLPRASSRAVLGIGVNITPRKLTEIALRESESKQKALINALPDLIMRMSGDGIYLDFFAPDFFGALGSKDLIGKNIADFPLLSNLANTRMEYIRKALATGEIQIYDQEIYINGKLHIQEVRIAVCGENEVLVIVRDISDRKLAENNLKQSEQRLKASESLLNAMFMKSAIGIAITDLNGHFVRTNPYYQELVGYSEQELQSFRFTDITSPEDLAENLRMRDLVLYDHHESYQMEKRLIHRDGYPVWVRITSSKIMDETTKEPLFVGVVENIGDRKQAEESLQSLVEGAAAQTGDNFLPALAEYIGNALNVKNVFVTKRQNDSLKVEIAWIDRKFLPSSQIPLSDSPCGKTIEEGCFVCSEKLKEIFPYNQVVNDLGVDSYVGIAIIDSKGEAVGSLCVMDDKPIVKVQRAKAMLQVFAARVSAEIEREKAIDELHQLNYQLESRVEQRTRELQFANQQLIVEMAERQKLVAIVENSTDFIALADRHGRINYINPAGLKLLGIQSSVRKLSILDFYFPEDRQELKQNIIDLITHDQTWEGELRLRHCQTHEEIPVLFSAFPIQDSWIDETLSLACIVRDIRDRKKAEAIVLKTNEELLRTNSELARATKLKDEFLANMSHELRTPLNAILGMSEGLSTGVFGEVNDRQRRSLTLIENSGRHLLELINDILDVAKIGAGKLNLEITPVGIDNLCKTSLNFVKQMANQKNIQVRLSIPSDLVLMNLDERRMRQALINLLSNAVKFTPQGGQIDLEAKVIDPEPDSSPSPNHPHYLVLSVTDTGIGIAPENISKLFQTFVQIDSSLSRQYTGTGLGLTLVKQIAELHGGSVRVTSQVNQGSCFSIHLPYNSNIKSINSDLQAPTLDRTNDKDQDLPNKLDLDAENQINPLILLAEDNPINVETFADYLTNRGYRLIFATNGQETIDLAIAHKPHLILMDIQMPLLDGLSAIQQIRSNASIQNIPIVALTALVMSGDRERCLQAGANEYLTKPVKLSHLATVVKELIRKTVNPK
ncbi:PAS domain S-box protein [Pseudanabaena sp. FACHB-1998]|uniref:PAS domain S-box protein n=1 Tax=Pseudanabaena sp. FACHB-1998 TaxID=2692858 RepID=UPI0016813ACE|nr:PAS domain S-box protein [Pseudanabaena sp. FACHB-1998]MBD2177600.1 PAS domain S-box protein [Pseudanabaena sp. FACHB-1998]